VLSLSQSTYLDFLRGAAAFAVLIGHASEMFFANSTICKLSIQGSGVFTFFILSGFLISLSAFRKFDDLHYTFKHFFIDRFCRIYVAFIPALVFVWLVDMWALSLPNTGNSYKLENIWIQNLYNNTNFITWTGNLLMLQDFPAFQVLRFLGVRDNVFFIRPYGSAYPFWTISIEWWIYLFFGIIFFVIIRKKARITLRIACCLLITGIVPFYYLIGGVDDCLSFLWIIGMLFSLVFLKLPEILNQFGIVLSDFKWRCINATLCLGSIFLMIGRLLAIKSDTGKFSYTELQFGVFLSFAIFAGLLYFQRSYLVPIFIRRLCLFFAEYSYSLYLTHFTVLTFLYMWLPKRNHDFFLFCVSILASNIIAIMFWVVFERQYKNLAYLLKSKLGLN
jgi:peptidoglycan/LPS O-acetylase OafA/YrhL